MSKHAILSKICHCCVRCSWDSGQVWEGLATPALDCRGNWQASKQGPCCSKKWGWLSWQGTGTDTGTDTSRHIKASMRPGNNVNTALLLLIMLVCTMKTKSATLQDRNFLQVIWWYFPYSFRPMLIRCILTWSWGLWLWVESGLIALPPLLCCQQEHIFLREQQEDLEVKQF